MLLCIRGIMVTDRAHRAHEPWIIHLFGALALLAWAESTEDDEDTFTLTLTYVRDALRATPYHLFC